MQPIETVGRRPPGGHSCESGQIPISGSGEEVWSFLWPPGHGQFWHQYHNLNNVGRGPLDDVFLPNMKALGQVVSDKKIFSIDKFSVVTL